MAIKSRKFLSEQLHLVLDELDGPRGITPEFLRVHLGSINEHSQQLIEAMSRQDGSMPIDWIANSG